MSNRDARGELSEEIGSRETSHVNGSVRIAGALLAFGSLLFVGGIAIHPPPSSDPGEFMTTISDGPVRWMAAHWATGIALSVFATSGLIVLTAGSRLTKNWWTLTAWSALIVSALLVTTAAMVEATVITDAAVAGDTATFETWQSFAEAYSSAFVLFASAIALIAANEARSVRKTTPTWASWVGAIAGIVAVLGFVLGLVVGIGLGGVIWLVSTIALGLWTLWFGASLTRFEDTTAFTSEESGTGRWGTG